MLHNFDSFPFGVHDVRDYGAVGNGVADDTVAVQAAITAAGPGVVFFPAGTYIVSNVTTPGARCFMGEGPGSVIQMKTGATGYMINCGVYQVQMQDLTLYGGSDVSRKSSQQAGTQSGLCLTAQQAGINQRLSRLTVHGFNLYGVYFYDTTNPAARDGGAVVSDCTFYYNNYGLASVAGKAEYWRVEACHFYHNWWSLYVLDGNVTICNNIVNDNCYGITFVGGGGTIPNDGHSNVVSCLVNHNGSSFYLDSILIGLNVVGCQIFQGNLQVIRSRGVRFMDCEIDPTAFVLTGNDPTCAFINNYGPSGYANTITRTDGDQTVFLNNVKLNGSYLGEPAAQIDVPRLDIADRATLGNESLTNGALSSGTGWAAAGDFALASDKATYAHSTGAGTLTQANGDLALAGIGERWYKFTYTVSGASLTGCTVTITTSFAAAATSIRVWTNGTYSVYFKSAAVPGDFVISCASTANRSEERRVGKECRL